MITETMDIIAADSAEWHQGALCGSGDYDPDLWYPSPGESPLRTFTAIRVCRQCPVIGECFKDAMQRRERFGIRAGLTANMRVRLLRKKHAGNRENRV